MNERQPSQLKVDLLAGWLQESWIPAQPEQPQMILWGSTNLVNHAALLRFDTAMPLPGGYTFDRTALLDCPVVVWVNQHNSRGDIVRRTGAYTYRFEHPETPLDIPVLAAFYSDEGWLNVVVAVPQSFMPTWTAFEEECDRLASALEPTSRVVIIGGRNDSFVPTTDWDDIILPADLKEEILKDVSAFFTKGIDVYKRLKLKPFRKLLLAGVPGTGKTMICSAMAKWALEQNYLVIYISSADREGSAFWKIQEALSVASDSHLPTLILLEELDAYLHDQEKALVLNVLDGSESSINDQGSLLVATTNYPEAIDERVLKRPGRLDRIFIVPETKVLADAEKMLQQYLGEMWQPEHKGVAEQLVGYPGAFIREVAIYALTQVAYEDLPHLSLDLLERSYKRLRDQIEARDDFLTQRSPFGLLSK